MHHPGQLITAFLLITAGIVWGGDHLEASHHEDTKNSGAPALAGLLRRLPEFSESDGQISAGGTSATAGQLAAVPSTADRWRQIGRRKGRSSNETAAAVHDLSEPDSSGAGQGGRVLRIQLTAIHVERAEFPLSKLLFKLTLRLALSEASKFLEQQQALLRQEQRERRPRAQSGGGGPAQPAARLLPRVRLALSVRSANTCSRQYASALAAEEFYVRRSRLFIVSGCDDAIRGVSRLASQWQVPIMTAAGFGAELNDKRVHRTLVRVAFSLRAAVEFLVKIMKSYQWRRVNLVVDESDPNSLALKDSIEKHMLLGANYQAPGAGGTGNFSIALNTIVLDLQSLLTTQSTREGTESPTGSPGQANSTASSSPAPTSSSSDDTWPNEMLETVVGDTLRQCALFSRVTILLLPQQYLRKFMISVYDQNMADGMYTFISMPLLAATDDEGRPGEASSNTRQATSEFLWRSAQPRARNAHAKQAFESLMLVYLRTPTTKAYVYFANNLNNLANSRANGSSTETSRARVRLDINPYSASFYDGIQIYARALNESLGLALREAEKLGPSGSSGTSTGQQLHTRISELVRNRRFENMVTGTVYINANGDRETDYTLDDMNQMTGRFAPVILYRGETRDIERLGRIHWSSDMSVGPTSDLVDCNLTGTCASKPMTRFTLLLVLMAAPLVVIMSGLFYFVHSRLSLESQLVDYWWKIHLSEIEIVVTRRKNMNDGSLVMTGASSVVSSQAHSSSQAPRMLEGGTAGAKSGVSESNTSGPQRRHRRQGGGGQSLIGLGAGDGDKTEVTRATTMDTNATSGTGGWATSAVDVCYGNITLGIFKLAKVALKPISKFHQSRKLMIELRSIKELSHTNLCRFVGILVDEGNLALVSEFCPKGSLREFFHNESMVIDWTFKYSIINDIIAGLLYLHSSPLGYHGRLKSGNCLVSARFVVKLADYGPRSLYDQLDEHQETEDKESWLRKRIWMAPEHMRSSSTGVGGSRPSGSMKGDVYSFGLLLYEIITNCLPFFEMDKNDYRMPLRDLFQALKTLGPNPEIGPDLSLVEASQEAAAAGAGQEASASNLEALVELMKTCWRLEASKRPTLLEVNASLKKITRGVTSKKLLENLTSRMEQYTNNLESLVEAKLATLVEEKLKTEELLYQFVPKSIASLLKEGQFVEPEAFECVTVFYSDIVGFTSLSSESSPMEVVGFLSDLYLCFDETLEQHDIFKVDTIGDAYIVASGLPQPNEGKHVIEIACAALELRERLQCFKIPHKPERSLEMRVGIHSGPCIAGIVGGLNMPKYCVFGDTLTTGKFMESSGLPMRIHITEESRALLAGVPDFSIEPRVPKITKEGLPFQTYWLEKSG